MKVIPPKMMGIAQMRKQGSMPVKSSLSAIKRKLKGS